MSVASAVFAELKAAEGHAVDDVVAWEIRGATATVASPVEKMVEASDPQTFLNARSAAREVADVILLSGAPADDAMPVTVYEQCMLRGLLKSGGLLVLEDASAGSLAPLLKMVQVDLDGAVLLEIQTTTRAGTRAFELSKAWSPGTPTPSMCSTGTPTSSDADSSEEEGLRRRTGKGTAEQESLPEKTAPAKEQPPSKWDARVRTLAAILYLWACAPLLCLWAFVAWARHRFIRSAFKAGSPKKQLRVLVTGGKMSKASAVARAVGRDGHKVFTAEILPYKYCHTRYCKYVSKHYVLPRPTVQPEEWEKAVQAIVAEQDIDLIIPCTAPVESSAYAHLRERLPAHVRVFAFDGNTSDELDNKFTFNQVLVNAGLKCPETAKMECTEDAVEFFRRKQSMPDDGKRYIVKPAVYDPKARTEILFLPISDSKRQLEYLRSRNARKDVPYVIQEVLEDPEYGSFAVYNQGELTAFELFESAASCLRYKQHTGPQYDAVRELHKGLGKAMNLTGQLTLDFMHTAQGDLVPIECNPRIHSAVCTLEGDELLGAAFTEVEHAPRDNSEVVTSHPDTFKYWVMDQMFLKAGFWKPKNCFKLSWSEMLGGTDAMLHGDDPLPFLAMYLLQIPSLLMLELLPGTPWLKIDFCIGKIVKEGGD